ANDGFSAGEIIATARPQVVVLDLRMPGMDGFEVCRKIMARPETASTVVIAMTALHSAKAKKEIIDCGADVYLTKPLDKEVLLASVDAAVPRDFAGAG
ncbi:MAG: response regulator, partial [Phycisphaerae bacterium]|nr:response regulator [Phycisphaerae bacterium]